jgi:hypothetical protein
MTTAIDRCARCGCALLSFFVPPGEPAADDYANWDDWHHGYLCLECKTMHGEPGYTYEAFKVITEAARAEHDFGGWLSLVLCRAAARLGSLDALTAGRQGSWEAALVDQLARGLAGDDEGLAAYRRPEGIIP